MGSNVVITTSSISTSIRDVVILISFLVVGSPDAKELLTRHIVAWQLRACVLRKEESGNRKYDSCSAWSRFEAG
jgi:hypothetical protein